MTADIIPFDPVDEFERRNREQEEAKQNAPSDLPPDVLAPDLLLFREVNNATDRALADGFFRHYRHLFTNGDGNLYVYHKGRGCWSRENVQAQVLAYCMHLSDRFYDELNEITERFEQAQRAGDQTIADQLGSRRTAIRKLIEHCEKARTMSSVATLLTAKLRTILEADCHRMNPDGSLLSVENGVVELATGALRHARPGDYLTRSTGVKYKRGLDTSEWDAVVFQICGGNPRLAEFVQVWAGYCATGYTNEHAMLIMWGNGRNGKNLLIDAIATAMGGYSHALPSAFLESMGNAASMDNNMMFAMAQLDGVRLAYVSETGEKGKMRESWVKSQTGDHKLRARLARENFYEFQVTHKLVVGTNHKPEITGTDDGVWERIRLMSMGIRFGSPEEIEAGIAQHPMIVGLLDKFTNTHGSEVILKWVVEGARKYLEGGLRKYTPPEISAQTKMYRREQDTLGQFLQIVTVFVPKAEVDRIRGLEGGGVNAKVFAAMKMDERLRVEKQDFWRIYSVWCEENGHYAMSATMFSRRITGAQRFWQDDVGNEQLMQPLEVVKAATAYYYRYVRLSDVGYRLRGVAHYKAQQSARQEPTDEGEQF